MVWFVVQCCGVVPAQCKDVMGGMRGNTVKLWVAYFYLHPFLLNNDAIIYLFMVLRVGGDVVWFVAQRYDVVPA